MPTVAEQLRAAREAQNLSISRVAEATNIKSDYLRALEAGRLETFSAPIYVKGFVRTYAAHLRLKVPELIAQLEGELAQSKKFAEPPPLGDGSKNPLDFLALQFSKLNWRTVAPVIGLVALIVIVVFAVKAFRNRQPEDPLAGLGPGVYRPAQRGEVLPIPTNAPPRR